MQGTVLSRRDWVVIPVAVVMIAVSVALSLLVHLIPPTGGVPAGARLLPMFIVPVLALVLATPQAALLSALAIPAVNNLLTGMPATPLVPLLTVEVVVFTVVLWALMRRWPGLWFNPVLAFGAAKASALVLLAVIPGLLRVDPLTYALNGIGNGLIGLVLLVGVYVLARRLT